MPSLQEIESFKTQLNSLGAEPELLAERGEAIEDLPPPEAGLPPDLSDLFEKAEAGLPGAEPAAPPSAEVPAGPPSRKKKAAPEEPPPMEEGFDFSSLFGEEGLEGLDILETPAEAPAAAEPAEAEEPAAEPVAFGEAEGEELPPEEAAALAALAAEEAAPAEAPAEAPEEAFPPFEAEAPMEMGAPPAAEEAAKPLEEFGIPPGLLEAFGEPQRGEEAVPEEAAPEEAMPEEAVPEEPAVEAAPPEEMAAAAPAAAPPPEGEEVFDFTLPPEFGIHEEAVEAPAAPAAPALEEEAPIPEEFLREEAVGAEQEAAPAPEPGEEAFALPEEFMMPTEEAAPAAEAPPAEAPPEAAEIPRAEGLGELPEEFAGEALFEEEALAAPGMEAAPPHEEKAEEAPSFEAPAEAPVEAPAAEAAAEERMELPPEGEELFMEEEFGLPEKRFAVLKRALAVLPRNLKMAIEELIGVRGLTGPDLRRLVDLLADGAAPGAIAEEASRITGRVIRLPKGYEKMTGLAFEVERRTFAYALRENILPVLRVALLSMLVLGMLSFLGYRYIYRPLYASALYRQGHSQIAKDRYQLANERFDKARAIIRFKGWYLRYADAFAAKRQYPLAADKYELLLKDFPLDKQGTLAYAGLLTYSMFGYERADEILDKYLSYKRNFKDEHALLARGDNYLEWAEEEPSHYENARLQYASILDYYGEEDEVLFRMMRYFVRVQPPRLKETHDLYALLESKERLEVSPALYASVYSEVAGFWFDRKEYDDVREALFKAMDKKKDWPEAHYQLARYYRYLQDAREEEKALKNSIQLLEDSSPFTRKRLLALIDSYDRLGEVYWRRQEYLDAETSYSKAIARIESAQKQRILGLKPELASAYENRGDIYYYISRDLRTAFELYRKAEQNTYRSTELDYKIGYIRYAAEGYEEGLLRFARVVDQMATNENALYALANAMYFQGYFSSAQGYYLRLLDLLEMRRTRIPFLSIADDPAHRALIEYLMKAYNNLGVTYQRLAERSRDPDKEAKALVNLTYSSEYFDFLTRNPETAERGVTKNLAYLNQRGILYPTRAFELQLYNRIPIDLEAKSF